MRTVFLITLFLGLAAVAPAQDLNWNYCSIDSVVGTWAYSYTGTLMLPTGAVPMAAVGRTTVDGAGNVLATQNSSTGGKVSQDTIKGTLTANPDCTGTMTV